MMKDLLKKHKEMSEYLRSHRSGGTFKDGYGDVYYRVPPLLVKEKSLGMARLIGFNKRGVIIEPDSTKCTYGFVRESIGPGRYLYVTLFDIEKAGCLMELGKYDNAW